MFDFLSKFYRLMRVVQEYKGPNLPKSSMKGHRNTNLYNCIIFNPLLDKRSERK